MQALVEPVLPSSSEASGSHPMPSQVQVNDRAEPAAPAVKEPTSASQPFKPAPALTDLEDILYDWLDCGASDPNLGQDKLDEIQAFLHEHARERKSHAHFVAFFERNGLCMEIERPSTLVMSRNTGRSMPVDVPLALELPAPAAVSARTGSSPSAAHHTSSHSAHHAAVSRNKPATTWIWAIGMAAVIGLLSLAVIAIIALRDELVTLNVQVSYTTQRLERLRTETDRLRSVVDDNTRSAQRVEGEVDSLLQAVTAPEDPNSR